MATTSNNRPGSISGYVIDCGEVADSTKTSKSKPKVPVENALPFVNAEVMLFCVDPDTPGARPEKITKTGDDGCFEFKPLAPAAYWVRCCVLGYEHPAIPTKVNSGCDSQVFCEIPLGLNVLASVATEDCQPRTECYNVTEGRVMHVCAGWNGEWVRDPVLFEFSALPLQGHFKEVGPGNDNERFFFTDGAAGKVQIIAKMRSAVAGGTSVGASTDVQVTPAPSWDLAPRRMAALGTGGTGGTGGIGGIGTGPNGGVPQVGVMLQRSAVPPTERLGFWARIRNHAKAVSFGSPTSGYQGFIERVLCGGKPPDPRSAPPRSPDGTIFPDHCHESLGTDVSELVTRRNSMPLHGMTAYELLMTATEIFLLWNCGVVIQPKDAVGHPLLDDNEEISRVGIGKDKMIAFLASYMQSGRLPYIERVVGTAFPNYAPLGRSVFCANQLSGRVDCVCLIELIWSYWLEEGMLAQTLNAISRRFQNIRGPHGRDPLAHLEIDPLRGVNNLMWGYLQNEQNQLTVQRRAYEYDHHYGLMLYGKAVPQLRSADSRSKFIEGFHNLLHRAALFYKEDNDTTVIADGFPLINALKEVHLLLAQGAHNQFGDLPWTARAEMMVQQWLLARPEMRDFLQSRPMVPYTEAWMPQVDTMKTLQGWSDVTITHFRDLAVYGEQILLSVRYDDWIDLNDENEAKNWARYWRPEIQGYIHAYRTVTGVDLTNPEIVDTTIPAVHLRKRLALQQAR